MPKSSNRRSFRSDYTTTLSHAEALVKDWPEISPETSRRVAALLRSTRAAA